ncbi:locomotion-related protein Hikaru genki-like isoform X2 [Dermacentor andersoni]|uniref:locomotion-related protein Hikaru genki-like isoform X2 n=1 Tax=Dermacentor andersoni TaxID=34620 RepID=UPI00241807CB|nr:locomotion-related protein Hikaru genki-like isoform X2 [Dermacentor andersoni]
MMSSARRSGSTCWSGRTALQLSSYGRRGMKDDALGCPGLDVLASGDSVVLSTHNGGRYRPPDLPSDALPVGSVVRCWCVPAGSHRLSGASELRCLASRRWSSKPPRCQPLPTLEQIMAGNTTETTPSIHYDGLVDDEWASSDDNGSLVVRPGANLRLKCLYPRSLLGGNVTWLHNGSVSRYGASVWAKGGPRDSGENAYMLEINRTTHQHSGMYSCETLNGTRHSITIKILDVHCNTPTAPENGEALVKGSAGQALVGSKAHFRCFLGYELRGSDVATCLGSGRWSLSSPKCEEREHFVPPEGSCQRPALQDGLTVSPDRKWYETGSRVRYSCQGGKVLVGMPTAQCHEGQWMGRNRSCL